MRVPCICLNVHERRRFEPKPPRSRWNQKTCRRLKPAGGIYRTHSSSEIRTRQNSHSQLSLCMNGPLWGRCLPFATVGSIFNHQPRSLVSQQMRAHVPQPLECRCGSSCIKTDVGVESHHIDQCIKARRTFFLKKLSWVGNFSFLQTSLLGQISQE